MPRPTARVLALLEALEAGGLHTATQLADRLGVDERTVRRYVDHLLDLDVPVRSTRGRYGGYALAPGYRMPPLMLTDAEAVAVVLGLRGGATGASASAMAKVLRVLPHRLRPPVDDLLAIAGFTAPPDTPTETEVLLAVAHAVRAGQAIAFTYRSSNGRESEPTLNPSAMVAHAGRWYVTGAGGGRERTYRLDRMLAVTVLDEKGASEPPADPAAHLISTLATSARRFSVSVLIETSEEHLRRRTPPGLITIEPVDADWVRMRLEAEELDWVPSLLAWIDRPFAIEAPPPLREHVEALADRLRAAARRGTST